MRNFSPAVAGFTQAGALMSLNVAVVTYMGCRKTSGALSSKVFNSGVSGSSGGVTVVGVVAWVVVAPRFPSDAGHARCAQ